jgi:2-keto-4-pentenoate hydratase/2-oxohepta-3-ene-1,7-dioic acid hydratase in catechol pathway
MTMRYCRYSSPDGPLYAFVEERDGELWATRPMPAPEEDRAAQPASAFEPRPLKELRLLAPVVPSKILCIGRNYRDHAAEMGNDVPKEPLLFLKPPSSLLAPGGIVRLPALSKRVDYEGELGIVIGRRCSRLGRDDDPRDYIRGYTIVNDVTARDLQKSDGQWTRGKGFDSFCPLGPWIETDLDSSDLAVHTLVNGEVRQQARTSQLEHGVAELLSFVSRVMTLLPGDVLLTGTPAGVGPLEPGDRVEVEVEGIGVLANEVVAEPTP